MTAHISDDSAIRGPNVQAPAIQARRRLWLSQAAIRRLLLFLLLLSFVLRVYRLGDKSVWWDEGLAAWAARQSPGEIAQWTASDVHPPLYFWLLHFWRWGSGDSEFGLRFLSVAFGVLTVAVAYRLGRTINGPQTGLLTALLVSVSRFEVWWSQEMRMYVLAALWAALSLWMAVRFWDRDRLVDGALYVLFTTAGLYTLYLSVSVMAVANLTWLLVLWRARRRKRTLLRWCVAQVAVLALFAPWLAYALGLIPTWSSASPVALGVFLRLYWTVLTVGSPVSVETYRWLTVSALAIFVLALLALLWKARRDGRMSRNLALLLMSLLLPAGVVYVVSLPRETLFYSPQLAPRYLLIFAPAFYALLAWGITCLGAGRWLLRGILAAVVVGVAGYGLWEYFPGRILIDDYKALAATLEAYHHPGDAVVLYTDADWPIFAYHHPGRWWGVPSAQPVTPQFAAAYLSPIWDEHEGIWLVVTPYAGVNDPQGEMPAWLAARAVDTVEHRFADKALHFYARTEGRASTVRELAPGARPSSLVEASVGSALRLVGYDLPVREYQSGDTIHLFLYWERGDVDGHTLPGLEVSLLDRHDKVWKRVEVAWQEGVLAQSLFRQQVDLVVPPEAASGRYTLAVRSLSSDGMVRLGPISLWQQQRAALTAADVTIAHPLETDFGDGVRLLGYDLETKQLMPGGTAHLTLYWQAREPVEHRYKVFTHLLGEVFNATTGNFLWGQRDNEPVGGTRATSTWRTGEVILDRYAIPLDPQVPAGRYAVEIGLYDPATGDRLPVLDGQGQIVADHLVLTHVTVE
jgi:4-amino-4-deoxy-L-arabinose transferase-like glycosyltransferase